MEDENKKIRQSEIDVLRMLRTQLADAFHGHSKIITLKMVDDLLVKMINEKSNKK